jgi:hypothetical protein
MSELQEQQFGQAASEAKLGYQAMEPVLPMPQDEPQGDISAQGSTRWPRRSCGTAGAAQHKH